MSALRFRSCRFQVPSIVQSIDWRAVLSPQLVVFLLTNARCLRRSGLRPMDVRWLVPSHGGDDEAAVARGPLARITAELVIGGPASEVRREAAAVIKAVWRLQEGQRSVDAQQVVPVVWHYLSCRVATLSSPACVSQDALHSHLSVGTCLQVVT